MNIVNAQYETLQWVYTVLKDDPESLEQRVIIALKELAEHGPKDFHRMTEEYKRGLK